MAFNENFEIQIAKKEDVPAIVELFVTDILGKTREAYKEGNVAQSYYTAFEEISCDPNNSLFVLKDKSKNSKVVGTFQLTFIPNMTFKGGKRAQVEGVHIHEEYRGQGLGKELLSWAIEKAKAENCRFLQLTSNKQRTEAIKFYKEIGFVDSHVGLKYDL